MPISEKGKICFMDSIFVDKIDVMLIKRRARALIRKEMNRTNPPPVRAFSVLETDESTGGIVFDRYSVGARRKGADRFNNSYFGGLTVCRAPWADEYVDKPGVPAGLCIDHGWRFECQGCNATITQDWLYDHNLDAHDVIGYEHGPVYCHDLCQKRQKARRRLVKRKGRRFLKLLRGLVRKRFGNVEFVNGFHQEHSYVNSYGFVEQAHVSFKFPGQRIAPASFRFNKPYSVIGPTQPEYHVCYGDSEAFRIWVDASKTTCTV